MGLLKKIGHGLQAVGKVAGKVLKVAAPAAAFIPGVGPLAAMGLGAAGSALGNTLEGHNLASTVKSGVTGGALAGAGAALKAASPSLLSHVPGMGGASGGVPGLPGVDVSAVPGASGTIAAGYPGGGSGLLGKIGGALGGMAGITHDASGFHLNGDKLLGTAAGVEGVLDARKANQLRSDALGMVKSRDAELAPLRKMGLAQIQNAKAPDLSSVFADPGNVYARPLRRMGGTP